MEIEILRVEQADLREILAIEEVTFPTPWLASFFRDELKLPICRAYCARLVGDGKPLVGYSINHLVMDEFHILNIATHPEYQRRGIATRLFRHAIEVNPVIRVVFLEVRERNGPARAFYRKLGFREIGRRKHYYSDTKEDAITMSWMTY